MSHSDYDAVVELAMRMGSWLSSPRAALLSQRAWDEQYGRYQQQLDLVRRMHYELRAQVTDPTVPRACSTCGRPTYLIPSERGRTCLTCAALTEDVPHPAELAEVA